MKKKLFTAYINTEDAYLKYNSLTITSTNTYLISAKNKEEALRKVYRAHICMNKSNGKELKKVYAILCCPTSFESLQKDLVREGKSWIY